MAGANLSSSHLTRYVNEKSVLILKLSVSESLLKSEVFMLKASHAYGNSKATTDKSCIYHNSLWPWSDCPNRLGRITYTRSNFRWKTNRS